MPETIRRIDVMSLFLIVLGILCLVEVVKPIIAYDAKKDWEAVSGRIISAKDVTQGDSLYEGKGPALLVKIKTVTYAYEVEYQTYRGVGYADGAKASHPGGKVRVYFNPIDPQQSTIDILFDWAYLLTWIILSAAVFITEYFWFRLRVKYRHKFLQRIPFRKKKKGGAEIK